MAAPGETILYVRCADDADANARVYAFTAVPSNSIGEDGDFAIITNGASSKLQQKIGGTWTDVAGSGGSVSSVFGRTGAVVAVSGDYTSTLVTNSSTVAGANVTAALDQLVAQAVPTGGTAGQYLRKTSGTNYDDAWASIASGEVTNASTVSGATVTAALNTLDGQRLPAGGTANQVLTKDSGTDYDVSWQPAPAASNGLPTGGVKGDLVWKQSGTNYDVAYTAIPQLTNQTTNPAAADAGYTRVHVRQAGLPWLASTSSIGGTVMYQRMRGTVSTFTIRPNTTTTVSSTGNSVTSTGTLSHPTPTVPYGWMTNFVTATAINSTAGTGSNATIFARGSATTNAAGFFFACRFALPDASYDQTGASTGSRVFVGLTNQTMATMVGADNPAGHYCGFARRSVSGGAGDTNWQFFTKDNVTLNPVDTGLVFTAAQTYVAYIYCATADSTIYWRLDNITAGTTAAGSTGSNLPGTTTYLRAGLQVGTVNAVARNIRLAILTCEEAR